MAARIPLISALIAVLLGSATPSGATQRYTPEELFPPIGKVFLIEGTPVHAFVRGSGPDLVLLHGAGGNLRDFSFDLVGRLADKFRVIAFDRPGFGYTGHPPGSAEPLAESPREQAQFLQKAADALGVRNAVVLGHSFGGAVAMAWALERPQDTAAVVILSGATMPWPGGLGTLYTINASPIGGAIVVPLISALATEGMVQSALDGIFAPNPVPMGYAQYIGVPLSLRPDTLRTNARQVTALRAHLVKMSDHYTTLQMPFELVHGTADTTVGPEIHSVPLAKLLSDANLTLLNGVGHMPHHAAPQAVVNAIERAATRAGLR